MFFEEKIELLKKTFPASDFKVPFVKGTSILKSIEQHFIIYKDIASNLTNLGQYHSSWAENMKSKVHILTAPIDNISTIFSKLGADRNYWVVLNLGNSTGSKHMAFDCKPEAILALVAVSQSNFFVGDKKYKWLISFQLNLSSGTVDAYKSGASRVPFE